MPVNGFSEVIKAVGHEPLGLYSLVFLILGSITYLLIKKMRQPTPVEVALLLTIVLLGFSGVWLAVVRADNKLTAQQEEQKKPASKTVVVKFNGERSSLAPAQVPFSNTSGQVNFGCGESKPVTVSWNAPVGAEQLNASAAWANTDNVKTQDQHVTISGTTVTASGTISGRDREWTGNCPGGGHGELILRGTFQILQPTAASPFESVQSGSVSVDKPLKIAIPTEKGLQIEGCEATIISDGVAPIVLHVTGLPTADSPDTKRDKKDSAELAVSSTEAVISITK